MSISNFKPEVFVLVISKVMVILLKTGNQNDFLQKL